MTDETEDERWTRLSRDRTSKPLPKRFYKVASATSEHIVALDGRTIKTPLKRALQLPNAALAQAVADEWQAQDKVIDPATMPLTRLANTAIDRAVSERDVLVSEITDYAGSDLVCYRAEKPAELVASQIREWDPVLAWASLKLDAPFQTTQGVMHAAQSEQSLVCVRNHIEQLDSFMLTSVFTLTTLTGSALLSLMVVHGSISPEQAWAAAHVDEDFQIAQWGEDDEARARRSARRIEFDAVMRLLSLLAG
jgi:chaperone required for assembly of F1-ATPase